MIPRAKIEDPKTPRPDDVEFDNEAYTNPKYAGTVWYVAVHLKDPTKPIIPLRLFLSGNCLYAAIGRRFLSAFGHFPRAGRLRARPRKFMTRIYHTRNSE